MSSGVSAGTQVKFGSSEWRSGKTLPRDDLSTIPFVGKVSGETPGIHLQYAERRRRDVGEQNYGSDTPRMNSSSVNRHGLLDKKASTYTEFATSHGGVRLPSNSRDFGFMPTADAVLFLSQEYVGSRQPAPPQRYFP